MPELQLLRRDHAGAVLAFELANRSFFATLISDRGDDYFEHFAERHEEMIARQEAGCGAFYVCIDDQAVVGRFNLVFRPGGVAELGYRVAESATRRGLATAMVHEVCGLANTQYGVRVIRAATSHSNVASQRVLRRAGFVAVGPAGPADLGGKTGTWYERDVRNPGS